MATPRQFRRRGRFAIATAVFVGALTVAAVAFGAVTTDKYIYTAGETVYITGDGMAANENVTVDVTYPDATLAQEHVVQADASGNFADTYTLQDTDPGGIYTVTATGQESNAVFTTTFDPTFNTAVTLNFTTPLTYGQSTSLTGTLTWGVGGAAFPNQTVHLKKSTHNDCTVPTSITDVTTDGPGPTQGEYSYSPFKPTAAGTLYLQAIFDGTLISTTTYNASHSDCKALVVNKAPTQTLITNTPVTTLALGLSLSVDYKVESAYGVSGNTTGGTASIDETDVLGTLGCGAGDTLSAAQSNADGSGAADAGFSATGTLSCTPTAVGSYTYNVAYSGDSNYLGSNSTPDQTLDVTQQTVQVCAAAPAIAGDYLRQNTSVKPGSKKWKSIITDVASQTGANGQFFAQHVCDSGYADAVIAYVQGEL